VGPGRAGLVSISNSSADQRLKRLVLYGNIWIGLGMYKIEWMETKNVHLGIVDFWRVCLAQGLSVLPNKLYVILNYLNYNWSISSKPLI